MRSIAVSELEKWLKENNPEINSVAIVGGSENDPEFITISKLYPKLSLTLFGIEKGHGSYDFEYFDLNQKNVSSRRFDLVLCSQVLEHVWNLDEAFRNLTKLVSTSDGLLWINCPASNMFHGSPQYYSAGYAPDFVVKHLSKFGFESLISNWVGSERLYFYTHALQYWPSDFELRHPFLSFRPLRSDGTKFISLGLLRLLGRLFSLLKSNQITHLGSTATETYVLAKIKDL